VSSSGFTINEINLTHQPFLIRHINIWTGTLERKKSIPSRRRRGHDFPFVKTGFLQVHCSQIPANPNLKRYVASSPDPLIDFIITYAGDDLSTYIDVNQPSLGIIQQRPEYTNIKGGIGILSSVGPHYLKRF